MAEISDPVTLEPVAEIVLPNAPLVRVIAQVRFPLVVAIEQRDFIAPFQEAIRADYPRLRREQTQALLIGRGGLSPTEQERVWRFSDLSGHWRITLAPEFLALETTAYTTRTEFFTKFRRVLEVLEKCIEPKIVDRLGIRYIDRIAGEPMGRIADLVRPEVRGITGTVAEAHLQHSLTESLFLFDKSRLLARWGRLPAGATVDPSAIEPINDPSWILDLDMFSTEPLSFAASDVTAIGEEFARRIYTFFRWAVNDEFLKVFGGQP
ncbi:MAG: TIGR04255 family protein [Acidobacteria bacterium]|nr:TIGR04255 family protein [Acidobacteriota bacterium]